MEFLRTCQECSHQQKDRDPQGNPTIAYNERKCRKCHSISLDYGSYKLSSEEEIRNEEILCD